MALERIPPQNLEAEQSLLGSLLIDQDAFFKVADVVRPDDFYRENHRILYETMIELNSRHEPIDILTLGNRLEEFGKLPHIGGRAYLVELANTVSTAANVIYYAQIIQKKATLRRLLHAAAEIAELGYNEAEDVDVVLDTAERNLFGVSQQFLQNTFIPIKNVLADAFERIDELHQDKGKLRGVPSGFTELDNLLAGLQRSDLVILAARPSVGKTSFAIDIARHVAVKQKIPVGIFSLEMSKEQLVDRMICAEAGVDIWKLRTGRLSERDDEFPRIGHALGKLSEAPIFIDDSPVMNIMQIRAKCRRLQSEHGLGLIILDYLQLLEGRTHGSSDNRVNEISEISRALKQVARELNIPVLALSQLSRAVEQSKPAIPKLSHLRESGSIEQDADVVLFIYRKAADMNYREEDLAPEEKNLAEVYIAKHRNGPTGMVRLFFDGQRTSFRNLDMRRAASPPSGAMPPPPMSAPPPIDQMGSIH
ncbi:MAG: Replicative DNA helicase [Candidatus Uhrbacteria bacterium GW2011_GWF2_41_16]|uniref:Replicative DNA helicase n=1 Tax=Candidatus Uhrbacteria bacterium GW2011_GWF2_41_16 TaxID=1618997 RepID=A0A0G0V945_9BACT|nr:MAG: Replicative DNA helicase [Candidatus Uhrbacteria bacterium GW2011_GWA2_41_10]KKR97484.1 MAG: Replicative DNA helicase [Candidatus Uhrbacteria bacterium GW2011_GWF2_41_16]HBP00145.1 replicative DNA helicase [Candidatus Uhrbacteria bacterium]